MRRRTKRQNSNIFSMLTKNQIVELKEAFNLIDTDNDTYISKSDLEKFLGSVTNPFTPEEVDAMMEEAGDKMTFVVFLSMIGEKLSNMDEESAILCAFKEFDEKNTGFIDEKVLRKWLTEEGDKIPKEDVDLLLRGVVVDGKVNYKDLTTIIKRGELVSK
ncbi:Myosin regulatory light chain 2, smooth muscle minor isoform [Astathelohania contejeani]|uniref:Myosin regulatory light chain 2, smooth muscle minor isoform n=1 Tax=Astathelohania contejeani TaxID=164912 RepID=A0ABQ7HXR0_9MICR|nr:Myosin regulatory light chain 2, smooth muscle minor isoform [Thelohania contejeani]